MEDYLAGEPNQIVVDYLASMTDSYFMALYGHLFPAQRQAASSPGDTAPTWIAGRGSTEGGAGPQNPLGTAVPPVGRRCDAEASH